jgi:nitrogen regulatory protein PII-like uncharacterized protein
MMSLAIDSSCADWKPKRSEKDIVSQRRILSDEFDMAVLLHSLVARFRMSCIDVCLERR